MIRKSEIVFLAAFKNLRRVKVNNNMLMLIGNRPCIKDKQHAPLMMCLDDFLAKRNIATAVEEAATCCLPLQ